MAKQKYFNGTAWEVVGTDAEKVALKDTSNKFTATDVEGAMLELFTLANDGKTRVANAVTAKGVSASSSDTFTTLASKIGQISTGKKWASGIVTGVTINDQSMFPTELPVNLDFMPSAFYATVGTAFYISGFYNLSGTWENAAAPGGQNLYMMGVKEPTNMATISLYYTQAQYTNQTVEWFAVE